MDRHRPLDDTAHLPLAAFDMPLGDGNALDHDPVLARQGADNRPDLAFVFAGYHSHFVSFFDVHTRLDDLRRK
jgi:hypothetical protein